MARYCSNRDRLAEEELYMRYAARVNALCRRYVGDVDEADDLMLETLIQALETIGSYEYRGKGSLYAWISRIAVNKSINQIRRRRWRLAPLAGGDYDNIPEPTEEEMMVIPDDELNGWIAGMSDLNRAVFNLYCFEGYPHREIANMLGITEKCSSSVLARARKILKGKIRQYIKEQEI